MAREAVLRDNKILTSRRYNCASATAITKGTPLFLSPQGYASDAFVSSWAFIGIAHADKDAAETGNTSITCDKGAVYDCYAGDAFQAGCNVRFTAGHYVIPLTLAEITASYAVTAGIAIEASDASGAQINVVINP